MQNPPLSSSPTANLKERASINRNCPQTTSVLVHRQTFLLHKTTVMARRRRTAEKDISNDVARTRTGRTRSSPSNQRLRRDKVTDEGSRGGGCRTQQSITREMVINRGVRNSSSSSRRGWRGEKYCIAGIVLSIAVNILVNGPQSVSAGFACLSNPCVFGVCVDDLNR